MSLPWLWKYSCELTKPLITLSLVPPPRKTFTQEDNSLAPRSAQQYSDNRPALVATRAPGWPQIHKRYPKC